MSTLLCVLVCLHTKKHRATQFFFAASMTTIQQIKDIEAEMARTQKNKATSFHVCKTKI